MPDIMEQNLVARLASLKGRLGVAAYRRRELQIGIEKIDAEVAQMEAQVVLIEATQQDLQTDARRREAEKEQTDGEKAKTKESSKSPPRKGES